MDGHEELKLYGGSVWHRALTAQEELVLHDRRMTMQNVDAAGDHLDTKALGLLQAASLVLALVAIAGAPALTGLAGLRLAGLATALGAFVLMLGSVMAVWLPRAYWAPGRRDWDEMVDGYLRVSTTDAFFQAISNYDNLVERLAVRNARKVRALWVAMVLFGVQVVGLLLLVLA